MISFPTMSDIQLGNCTIVGYNVQPTGTFVCCAEFLWRATSQNLVRKRQICFGAVQKCLINLDGKNYIATSLSGIDDKNPFIICGTQEVKFFFKDKDAELGNCRKSLVKFDPFKLALFSHLFGAQTLYGF